jgi:dipeptidyl aminopeptidase/acylaminoacyl peptidase
MISRKESKNKEKSSMMRLQFLVFLCLFCLSAFGQNTFEHPTSVSFVDNGHQIQGWLYEAKGNGPFSTVILLHGSVGNEGDYFGLGECLSKEGFNVLTYNYPGSWKSEGVRTDETALSSVQSAIGFVMSSSSIALYSIDTSDIILVGYSYGGGMALLGAAKDKTIKKVISIAGVDLSVLAEKIEKNQEFRSIHQQMIDRTLADPDRARGPSGKEYHELLLKNRNLYNLKNHSTDLVKKEVLFIGGWFDFSIRIEDHILPLYRELQLKKSNHVKMVAFETDHRFTNVQEELADCITNWLRKEE